ncbi:MAG: Hsp20/alpha crystallin family protein [Oscillospiraceae bacterium]
MFGITPFERKSYDLFDAFHDFENEFFGGASPVASCRTDIRDDGDKYVMEAELPGFDKEDIKLDINGSALTLSAEHSSDTGDKDKDGNYIRRERTYGSYRRTFDISGVDADRIGAEYKNGILTVSLPKKAAEVPQGRRLEIK